MARFSDQAIIEAYCRQGGECFLCHRKLLDGEDTYDAHHIRRRASGGTDRSGNCALLHTECHERLHGAEYEHYRRLREG